MADTIITPPSTISLRLPSKYSTSTTLTTSPSPSPPLEWLHGTWSVTHSTLSMWRAARNVRITYTPLEPAPATPKSSSTPRPRLGDMVAYEASSGKGGVKRIAGVDTATTGDDTSVWDWRGKGWMFVLSSHWEVLGWGERPLSDGQTERWAVTWFAATKFTKEGLDIYSDRREGGSKETVEEIIAALKTLGAKPLVELCERDMVPVEIVLPWKET
ncbi:hypothetical protein B0T17DRAFT_20416 [Bombardia bombarda]|uniref:Uncharacterized protein n=1 Tax=Bombardia bombarda TaxID=252184 RepID=A0AA40CEW1_9PEZI|nr:hypothetical protein B0T17DRAFT_20416 [Bombardia bombarda]